MHRMKFIKRWGKLGSEILPRARGVNWSDKIPCPHSKNFHLKELLRDNRETAFGKVKAEAINCIMG